MDFWQRTELLLRDHLVVIDRPKGSRHPRFAELVYPLDYGYLKGISGSDGNAVDVWRGSLCGACLTGVVCTVDSLKRDAEVKLLIDCTDGEIDIVESFYNSGKMMSGLAVRRKASVKTKRR